MRRLATVLVAIPLIVLAAAPAVIARDKPYSSADLIAIKIAPGPLDPGASGLTKAGGQYSVEQIEKFTCDSSGNPATAVDMSCNTTTYGQDWAPDNEIAIAVDPLHADHLLAGSNDYFYRFNNSTGARQALVPTGFFTSFDGGETWHDGQIPMQFGNGGGDPAPAFDAANGVALMAQLENKGGQSGPFVTRGDVSVSRSTDGGLTWNEPVTVMKGSGAGIGPANNAVFWDKEWLTVDNDPDSPFYGRAYVTATRFLNGLQGSYAESPIYISWSDDGGKTWSKPKEISGSNASCTYQETGGGTDCDEDQFSIPTVAPDGTVYVQFLNGQNQAAWEVNFDFDSQLMVVSSGNGGQTWSAPVAAAQFEDGLSDMPYSVIGRQTVWGHQIRWASAGNIVVDPTDSAHVTAIWSDREAANPNATDGCVFQIPGTAPNYDPCNAGPGTDLNVYRSDSMDGGQSWTGRTLLDSADGKSQWFPWAGYKSNGTLVAAWDEDTTAAPADVFNHVLWTSGGGKVSLSPGPEQVDISVTHWSGQYTTNWPVVCGPAGYSDPGKDCNVFHGDYTGLAVGPDDDVHVVWTGLNRLDTSPQIDFYTGEPHDGYVQDAMYARR
jgi:hypothetical protein